MTAGHDLAGLMAFLAREAWQVPFAQVLDEHLGSALDAFGLSIDDLDDLLGETWLPILWGCAFEDFLTRRLPPDGTNLVEDYLRRRGYRETARTKAYMRALQGSVMSLYEVSEIEPGRSLLARDLIRGGVEPVLVREGTATRTLRPWDRVAARVVAVGGEHVFAGGLLPFSATACETLFAEMQAAAGGARTDGLALVDDERLRKAAPLFSTAWLFEALPGALDDTPPVLLNGDGDEIVFHDLRFPLAKGVRRAAIRARIDASPALRPAGNGVWNWIGPPASAGASRESPSHAPVWEVTMEDGMAVFGSVEFLGRHVIVHVNSLARAIRATALLKDLLGEHILAPEVLAQSIAQMIEARGGLEREDATIPVEIATPLIHDLLDRRYRETLDQPVPMIGGVSPREAVRTAEGRERVVAWLKHLENGSAGPDRNDPMASYDFGWMWRELGIAALRR